MPFRLFLRIEAEESAQQVLSGPLAVVGIFGPVFHEEVQCDSAGRHVDGHGGETLVWQCMCSKPDSLQEGRNPFVEQKTNDRSYDRVLDLCVKAGSLAM